MRAILHWELPDCAVWAFGSRVQGTAQATSDLDLAVLAPAALPLQRLGQIQSVFAESYLPMSVDVVDWHRVSPEFRAAIAARQTPVQEASTRPPHEFVDRSPWRAVPLEDCVLTIMAAAGPVLPPAALSLPLVTPAALADGSLTALHPAPIPAPTDCSAWIRGGVPRRGDVLLSLAAPLGAVARLPFGPVALAPGVVALRARPDRLADDFLAHLLRTRWFQEQLQARTALAGTANGARSIGINELRQVTVAYPPIPEQLCLLANLVAAPTGVD